MIRFYEKPIRLKVFHHRYLICDKMGRELFELNVIRPSIEAWKDLQEWGDMFCLLFNGTEPIRSMEIPVEVGTKIAGKEYVQPIEVMTAQEVETNGHTETIADSVLNMVRRGKGRPKGSKNK